MQVLSTAALERLVCPPLQQILFQGKTLTTSGVVMRRTWMKVLLLIPAAKS